MRIQSVLNEATEPIQCHELWFGNLEGQFYASPVVADGRIYTVDSSARFFVLDAQTGQIVSTTTLDFSRTEEANVYPSLCQAGNLLFIGNDAGELLVVDPANRNAVVGKGCLPRGSGATPAFSGERMYIRGDKFLYCVGPR